MRRREENMTKLSDNAATRAAALLVIFIATVTTLLRGQQNEVQVKLTTKRMASGEQRYAALLINKGKRPIAFEALPDRGFAHSACTKGLLFAISISSWNHGSQMWEPRDTFVSGAKVSVKGDLSTGKFLLQPGRSLCAGWWSDFSNEKLGEELRITVCESFRTNSQCYSSPSFRPLERDEKTERTK